MNKLFKSAEMIMTTGVTLAEYKDVEFYLCIGGKIEEGFYQLKDGVIEVCGEDEDYEIVFIKNKTTCKNDLKSIAS